MVALNGQASGTYESGRVAIKVRLLSLKANMASGDPMASVFDIFSTLPDGTPLWMGSVEGFDEARSRMSRLAKNRPGKYFLYSEESGEVIGRSRDEERPEA